MEDKERETGADDLSDSEFDGQDTSGQFKLPQKRGKTPGSDPITWKRPKLRKSILQSAPLYSTPRLESDTSQASASVKQQILTVQYQCFKILK